MGAGGVTAQGAAPIAASQKADVTDKNSNGVSQERTVKQKRMLGGGTYVRRKIVPAKNQRQRRLRERRNPHLRNKK